MRKAKVERKTKETDIKVEVNLDGIGNSTIKTPIMFCNHMLTTLSKHSLIDINIDAKGDSTHHIIEDTAITLAEAINKALGDKKGIERFGDAVIPMDETLVRVSLDVGGRSYFVFKCKFTRIELDDLAIEELIHFFETFAFNLKINLHMRLLYGENDHHKVEALFKALAISLRRAFKINERVNIPSTKGVL